MDNKTIRLDQDTDWGAVGWAGLISSIFFLVGGSLAGTGSGGGLFTFIKIISSMLLGTKPLLEEGLSFGSLLAGIVIHLIISFGVTAVIALVLHRWGILVGVIGGALMGLAFYFINFFSLADWFFPAMSGLRSVGMAGVHMLFGALAGGLYEIFEDEIYEKGEWFND
ncbi:MAG: hypothetical protein AB8G95_28280 [Anaerolineae bacterium]